ncbi:protein phosphatase 1 regulatory subunit 15B [Ambystoma mexicanum]|uniref:protein phosphatase 1 regulatory subunit 15B n=1 Tax=Ambystoma mexicanum TaxID=8296 RepID=UPI0037E8E1A7
MEGTRHSSLGRRPGTWLSSLARLCRPLPALLLRLLLGLPARWLQLLALAWGALLGRDRLLLQAEEEEAEWQEVLQALRGGGPLHPQALYLGPEPLLWESGVKGIPADLLEGLRPGLLDGIPTGLLDALPAEVLHQNLKMMMGAEEGPMKIQAFPGFGLVSCMLGTSWAEYEACGKDTGVFPGSYCQGEACKDSGSGRHSPWQDLEDEFLSSMGKGSPLHASKRTGQFEHVNKWEEPPESVSKWFDSHEEVRAEPATPASTFTDFHEKLSISTWPQPPRIVVDPVQPSTEMPLLLTCEPVLSDHVSCSSRKPLESPPMVSTVQASAEGPGSLALNGKCTKQELPELQLIRTKRLDFLQQLSKADLLPTPDQDHGYYSLEENPLLNEDPDTPSSVEGPLTALSRQNSYTEAPSLCEGPQLLLHQYSDPLSSDDHPTVHSSQLKDPSKTSSCPESLPWLPTSTHYTSNVFFPHPETLLVAEDRGMGGTCTEPHGPLLAIEGNQQMGLVDTSELSFGSDFWHTSLANDHDEEDSDIEEDLPAPVRPVCNNKLIDYILGAVSSEEEGESSDSENDWDEEEGDDGFDSEGSLSVQEDSGDLKMWMSYSSHDPYNPQNFTATIETAPKIKEEPAAGGSDCSESSDSEKSSWGESPPGSECASSDEESECSADEEENLRLWNSFNNSDDPYNPLHFKAPFQTVSRTKTVVVSAESSSIQRLSTSHCCVLLSHQVQHNELHSECTIRSSNPKKVTFLDEVVEHYIGNEDRKGPWEEYARDRCRFQKRVKETERAIGRCFTPQHRQQLWDLIWGEHCS